MSPAPHTAMPLLCRAQQDMHRDTGPIGLASVIKQAWGQMLPEEIEQYSTRSQDETEHFDVSSLALVVLHKA